jgi:hypothetical protein
MSEFEIYTLILCLSVFVLLVGVFSYFVTIIVKQTLRQIRGGLDDEEIINTFLNNSINAIVVEQRERLKDICYKVTDGYLSLKFTTVVEGRDNLLPMLKQALTDYLVNELLIQWLFIRQRAWSDSYVAMRSEHYNRVRDIFASFHNRRIRRRPTNLAGI